MVGIGVGACGTGVSLFDVVSTGVAIVPVVIPLDRVRGGVTPVCR